MSLLSVSVMRHHVIMKCLMFGRYQRAYYVSGKLQILVKILYVAGISGYDKSNEQCKLSETVRCSCNVFHVKSEMGGMNTCCFLLLGGGGKRLSFETR